MEKRRALANRSPRGAGGGFTAIETLLTLGIIAVTTGLSVPMYRNFQIRNDLDLVTEQTMQGLRRAQILAQSGEDNASWGFYARDGVLYQGEAYAVRDPQEDENYPVPSTVNISGLIDVSFSRVDGVPSQTGEITIEALSGERRIIIIGYDGVLSISGTQSAGEGGSSSGGAGSGTGSSSSSISSGGGSSSGEGSSGGGGSSSAAGASGGGTGSGGSSGGGAGSSGGGAAGPACDDRFSVGDDGKIITTGNVQAVFEVLGSQITYGARGPEVQVKVTASTDNGVLWTPLFGGADVDGGEKQTVANLPTGSKIVLKVNGRYSWYFNKTYDSGNSDGHIRVLRNGDTPPEEKAFDNQADLASFLANVIGEDGKIRIGQYDAIYLVELGSLDSAAADFQDAVIKVTFSQTSGSCAASDDPSFKVHFNRVENTGKGDTQKKVFVGEQGTIFGEDEWIPLKSNTEMFLDNFLSENVPGLAAWRGNGSVRVLLHGSLPGGSKEIVDADIAFKNAKIVSIGNDTGQNATESPFDGVLNDGPGGDEVTVSSDHLSVLYQARVTGADDAILIFWQEQPGAGVEDADTGGGGGGGGGGTDAGGGSAGSGATSSSGSAGSAGSNDSSSGDLDDDTPDPCGVAFTVTENGQIIVNEPADVTFRVRGSHMTYGVRGPEVRSYMSASFDGGAGWQSLFGFRDVDGGERQTFADVASGSKIALRAEGRYSWLFRNRADSVDGSGRIKILRRKDSLPGTKPYASGAELQAFMRSLIAGNKVKIGKTSLLLLFELQNLNDDSDYQDAVVEVILERPVSRGICGSAGSGGKEEDDDAGSGGSSSVGSSSSASSGSASSGDSGGSDDGAQITICHFPPGNKTNPQTIAISPSGWPAHQNHGDREGACEDDTDGDSIENSRDLCPDTYMPEGVPGEFMLFKRYALTANGPIFREGPRKKVGQFTLVHTRGCSCEQIVDVAEGRKSYYFDQIPRLKRQVQSLFPFYTDGARQNGCGKAIINMIRKFE